MRKHISVHAALGAALLAGFAHTAMAQSESDFHRYTWSAGGGFTTVNGADAGKLDHGGNFQGGGGYNFNKYLGITGTFMFSKLGITGTELTNLNQPDGTGRVYTATVDPTFHFQLGHGVSAYLLAGGGFLRRTVEFTQPSVVSANQVSGSTISNAGAYDVGAGLNIPLPNTGLRLYVEARYFHGFTDNTNTELAPISVGIRW
jgi:opacity protein-like surface antigen